MLLGDGKEQLWSRAFKCQSERSAFYSSSSYIRHQRNNSLSIDSVSEKWHLQSDLQMLQPKMGKRRSEEDLISRGLLVRDCGSPSNNARQKHCDICFSRREGVRDVVES